MVLSVVICTYNRSEILQECLKSIIYQSTPHKTYNIIIIDNNSSDNTFKLIQSFRSEYNNIHYFLEKKQGLSYARNRGFKEAQSDWVVYIDDDAKVPSNFVQRVLLTIENYDFDCFGGMFYAWYHYGKPKWLPMDFGNMTFLRNDVGLIDGENGWLCGGNFAFKKEILCKLGGFDKSLGMSGDQLGYGEDDYIQQQLLAKNYKIGFDPNLVVYHAVLPHKFKLSWHLKSAFQLGRTKEQLMKNKRNCIAPFFELVISSFGFLIKRLPIGLVNLTIKKNYYWQNLVLDNFQPILFRSGSLIWNCKNRINKNQ